MYKRLITQQLRDALSDTPVVLLCGARQTGKTTLVRDNQIVPGPVNYVTLDDVDVLNAALSEPAGYISNLASIGEPVVIDEVQRAPVLISAIKASVDRKRRPGRFLLTGSANILLLPKLSESLAGRMEILTLWPLSQSEIEGHTGSFVDTLFEPASPIAKLAQTEAVSRDELIDRMLRGGYPEPLARSQGRRVNWYESYLTTILQRDVRDLSNIEAITQMPRLLTAIAARAGSLMNTADISRTLNIPYTSLQRYIALLETAYLIRTVPAWSGNTTSRLVKAPKVFLNDSGLSAHLVGITESSLVRLPGLPGGLLENFAMTEVLKDAGTCRSRPRLYHWHTASRHEVDMLLETPGGRIAGIEVKASTSVNSGDFKGLRALSQMADSRFVCGVVLYSGEQVIPFGERMYAAPISALWSAKS